MHQFFQGFGVQQPPKEQISNTPELQHNLMVLEIANNWEFVLWLLYRIRENMVKQVDTMEAEWHKFITVNNINIESYKNADDFVEKNLRAIAAEKIKEPN